MRQAALKVFLVLALALPATACASKNPRPQASEAGAPRPALVRFGQSKAKGDVGIGVNSFLWRATLDTLGFMPVASADPFGGTYITEWHANTERPLERFKIQVFILDTRLRADGIAVQVFRQINNGATWVDASVDPDTPLQIENAILTRARQLRISSLDTRR